MRKLLTLLALCTAANVAVAQTTMNIYQNNGSVLQIPVSSIDSITYTIGNQGNLATLATLTVGSIGSIGATSGGNITASGGTAVTQRGVVWSTTPNPTTANSQTSDGSGTGSYTSNLAGLAPNTTYYVRAYATNSAGTAYGNELSFTTTASGGGNVPVVTTLGISSITGVSAQGGGNVTSNGGETIVQRGLCWSTSPNPTTADFTAIVSGGIGTFNTAISGLQPNTTYYVRAYATNSNGTGYGNEVNFTTNTSNIPVVNTGALGNITSTTAILNGSVTSDGGETIVQRGLCWSTSPNASTSNSFTPNGTGAGSFTSVISPLQPNTTYYARAYATNAIGTAYGSEVNFTTPSGPSVPACNSDPTYSGMPWGFYPDSMTFLSNGPQAGFDFNEVIDFVSFADTVVPNPLGGTVDIKVDAFKIVDVTGLPTGFQWAGNGATWDEAAQTWYNQGIGGNCQDILPIQGCISLHANANAVLNAAPPTGYYDYPIQFVVDYRWACSNPDITFLIPNGSWTSTIPENLGGGNLVVQQFVLRVQAVE
ncbi:MAG: hypothetical protein K9J06_08850 [Flavobacteriales bacterium]|nr:hypothetical protein [Flavobacteriales bacterium]